MSHLVTIADDSPRGHHWIDKQTVLWMQRSVTRLTEKGHCATGHGGGEDGVAADGGLVFNGDRVLWLDGEFACMVCVCA